MRRTQRSENSDQRSARTMPVIPTSLWGVALLALWGVAFCLSCVLSQASIDGAPPQHQSSFAQAVLGESREVLSRHFAEKADEYYHGGHPHSIVRAFNTSPYQRLLFKVTPEAHVHLSRGEMNEVMPWLWLAIRSDPQNIRVYLDTAFLLSTDIRRPDLAIEILREAQTSIPRCFQAPLEIGRILLKQGKIQEAWAHFRAAEAFWPSTLDPTSDDARDGKARLLLYTGLLHEASGDVAGARQRFAELLSLFPTRKDVRRRLTDLETGVTPSVGAIATWRQLLTTEDAGRKICPYEREQGHAHRDHDHHDGCEHGCSTQDGIN